MSLETLLEAAKYLEYRSEVKARGEEPHDYSTFSKLCALSNDVSNLLPQTSQAHRYSTAIPTVSRSPEEAKERRRGSTSVSREPVLSHEQGGTGTREVHNKLEKNRRAHLKECFEALKKQLPNMDDRKTSNLSILRGAIRYIQTLKRKEREHEHDMERLAREKIAFQQRLSSLKKDLSLQFDHIDVSVFLPDGDNETTTTASECGAVSDFDDELPREVSSTSNHNSNLVSDMTSSSSSSTASGTLPRSLTAAPINASATHTLVITKQNLANSVSAICGKDQFLAKTVVGADSQLTAIGKTSMHAETAEAHSISLPNSDHNIQSRVIPAGNLQAVAGILATPMQVLTQQSALKVITAANSISASSAQHLSLNHRQQGQIHVLAPSGVSYGTATSIPSSNQKSVISDSLVPIDGSALSSSKQQLVSPVALVSPQAFVGITQVGTVNKPLIINQTSNLSDLMTSSGAASSLAVTQGLIKPVLSSSILTANLAPSAVTLSVKSNNTVSVASSGITKSNAGTPVYGSKSQTQVIQSPSTAQNVSNLISEGSQVNNASHQISVSGTRPHSVSSPARSLTYTSGIAHVVSQSSVTAPVSQLVSPGNHVSSVTPLVGSVSVVSHTGTIHHPQSIGKVLASPLLKSMNPISQIPIIQQQFLQQAPGSSASQHIVKPVVVVSMPNIVPAGSVSPLAPRPLLSGKDISTSARGSVLSSQK